VVLKPEMYVSSTSFVDIHTGRHTQTIMYADDENVAYVTLFLPYQFVYCISLGFS